MCQCGYREKKRKNLNKNLFNACVNIPTIFNNNNTNNTLTNLLRTKPKLKGNIENDFDEKENELFYFYTRCKCDCVDISFVS